jgi:adenosylcobinamide kinase/adenosylcobinamide-phosphate guanylyltransferase
MTSSSARRTILVGGGARSGKSGFALGYARALGGRKVFLATAEGLDDEMGKRIATHRAERGEEFVTLEVPRELPGVLAEVSSSWIA